MSRTISDVLLYDISVSKKVPAEAEINAIETAKVIFEGLKPASGAAIELVHVKPGGNDAAGDGSSWSTAKGTVQAALDAVIRGLKRAMCT